MMPRLIFFFFLLVIVLPQGCDIKGVPKELCYEYALETFVCNGNSIPKEHINDDYCDCPNGRDEPGTSACSNGKFWCENPGFKGKYIFSSRVGDQICDCCDGSDELPGTCQNICEGEALEAKKDLLEALAAYTKGVAARQKYDGEATISMKRGQIVKEKQEIETKKSSLEGLNVKLEELRELERIRKEKEEEETSKQREEEAKRIAEEEAAKGPSVEQTDETNESTENTEGEEKEQKEGEEFPYPKEYAPPKNNEEDNLQRFSTYLPKVGDFIITLKQIVTVDDRSKTIPKGTKLEISSIDEHHQIEVIQEDWEYFHWLGAHELKRKSFVVQPTEEKKEKDGEEDSMNFPYPEEYRPQLDKARQEALGESGDDVTVDTQDSWEDSSSEEEPFDEDEYDDESEDDEFWNEEEENMEEEDVIHQRQVQSDELKKMENEVKSVERGIKDLERDIEKIENFLQMDFGEGNAWAALADNCYSIKVDKYDYEICLFDKSSQKEGSRSTSLGNFESIVHKETETIIKFTNGQSCWKGPKRSLTVHVTCGENDRALSATEPSMCAYEMEFISPVACNPRTLQQMQESLKISETQKGEL